MVYDLSLHMDSEAAVENVEEVEIRRCIFWGASSATNCRVYTLGRPIAIHLRDAHVSHELMDTTEEREPWTPYIDNSVASEQPPANLFGQSLLFPFPAFSSSVISPRL